MKKLSLKNFLLSAALSAVSMVSVAGEAEDLLERLQKTYPNIPFSKVAPTEAPGIYEAVFGVDLLYTDKTGTYFFPTMFNMKTQRNFGEERRAELSTIDFSTLPLGDAMKFVTGDGSRVFAVFSDPNCGFCKRLEEQLTKLNDITVYVFPVGILGPDSNAKVESVMCANGNKNKIWMDWMTKNTVPESRSCGSKIGEKNFALFRKLGFQGTPALAFKSGKVLKGYGDAAKIETLLAAR